MSTILNARPTSTVWVTDTCLPILGFNRSGTLRTGAGGAMPSRFCMRSMDKGPGPPIEELGGSIMRERSNRPESGARFWEARLYPLSRLDESVPEERMAVWRGDNLGNKDEVA